MHFHSPPPHTLPQPADGYLIISDQGLMEQKILHPWNRFPQTNLHFANYGPSLLPNECSLVTSTCSSLHGRRPPPAELSEIDFADVVCGNGVTVSHICLLKLTLLICMFPFPEGRSAPSKARRCQSDQALAKRRANQYDIISGSEKTGLSEICLLAKRLGTKAT